MDALPQGQQAAIANTFSLPLHTIFAQDIVRIAIGLIATEGREGVYQAPVAVENCPALVLNADYRPLSYYPLSLWSWQDAVKAVFMDRVNIVSEYDRIVRSPSSEFRLPSVVSLKTYIKPARYPAFTRFNVF